MVMRKVHFLGSVLVCAALPLAAFDVSLDLHGSVRLGSDGTRLAVMIHSEGWKSQGCGIKDSFEFPDAATGTATFDIVDQKPIAHARASLVPTADRRALLDIAFESLVDQKPEAIALSLRLGTEKLGGLAWKDSEGASGTFPKTFNAKNMCVYTGTAKSFTFTDPASKQPVTLTFPVPTHLMLQDDRQWEKTFTLRISTMGRREFPRGDVRSFLCFISTPDGVNVSLDKPVVVARGADWIPLDYRKDIEAGSALDFSNQGLQDAPAGKHGWLKNVNGHFEFEKLPGSPQRFYGVNLCFDASFPDHQEADQIVTRLVRLGYNTVRIHHYESANGAIKGSADGVTLNPERMDRLDYLLAKFYEKGVYVTTDLFTCRPVAWRAVGIDRDGRVDQQVYKNLVPVHGPAFDNWKAFAKNFLTHVNRYTGRRYIDEPALPLISLINEGHLTWCWDKIKHEEPMKKAWRDWLAKRRAADPSFAKGVSDDATQNASWNNPALITFMADLEADLSARERAFLQSIGLKAMLTSENCGSHHPDLQIMREKCYDYVDDHFYVDHPEFLRNPWSLPSKCGNKNPVLSGWLPPVHCAYTRLADKPFTITEWNFSGPGMFRGVGGIITGAMSALQDWDGLWRFAYSHGLDGMRDRTGFPGYFDVASDPLGQASDRASVCLFLRGDMPSLAERLALDVTDATGVPANGKTVGIVPDWHDAAWNVQVATSDKTVPGTRTFKLGERLHAKEAPVPLPRNERLVLDRTTGSFRIDTARTAGGFTPKGALTAGPVAFDAGDVPTTVWASSLDGQPLASSKRLLLTHLTDVQADGNVYADREKTVLLKWGSYPPVVRNGKAAVELALADPAGYSVWALETTGRRLEKMPAQTKGGKLCFTADVKGPNGARMLYEIVKD